MKYITPILRALCAGLLIVPGQFLSAQILPVDDGSSGGLYQTPLTKSFIRFVNPVLPVGRTIGSHAVTPTGGAAYTIPIPLPPGTAGMVPDLSITYNSQGGDGPLGIGWGITGSSAITRTQKNILHDGKVEAIKWDNTDPIALDGMRLMKMSGSALANGAVYAKEVEDFSKIYVYSNAGQPYFEVWTKAGLIYRYGFDANSRITNGNGVVLSWMLDKVRDLDNNYYSIEYATQTSGERVMFKIKYTGNAQSTPALSPYWEVRFEYLTRTSDQNELYVQDMTLPVKALLRRIVISRISDGAVAKKYYFNYGIIDNHSLLREITEVGKNGTTLNSTAIRYGETLSTTFNPSIEDGNATTVWLTGDFNGDGLTDLVNFYESGNLNDDFHQYDHCNMFTKTATGSGFVPFVSNYAFTEPLMIEPENKFLPMSCFDYNGDGIDDLILLKAHEDELFVYLDEVHIYESPFINGTLPSPTVIPCPTNAPMIDDPTRRMIPGDFNGDGRIDFITIHAVNWDEVAYLTLSGTSTVFQPITLPGIPTWESADHLKVMDFNGDGASDILVGIDIESFIYQFKQSGSTWQIEQIYNSGFPTQYHTRLYPGDFNGDGRTDLLNYNGQFWRVAYSTGIGFMEELIAFSSNINTNTALSNIVVGDYNGDGLTDFIEMEKSSPSDSASTIMCYKSTGKGFSQTELTDEGFYIDGTSPCYLGDFNGDGRSDILYRNNQSQSQPMQLIQVEPGSTNRLAEMISDGYAYNTEFLYTPLTNADIYTKGPAEVYPLCKTQLPIYVVAKTTVPDGVDAVNTSFDDIQTWYTYEEAVIHKQGRGFFGFKHVEQHNSINSNVYHSQDYFIQPTVFLPFATYALTMSGTYNMSSHRVNAEYISLSNNRWWLRTNWTRDQDFINKASNYNLFISYDSYGNVTDMQSTIGESLAGDGVYQYYEKTETTYGTLNASMNPGKVTSTTVTMKHAGEPQVSKTTDYTYVSSNHRLSQITEWPGMAKEVRTDFSNWNWFGLAERTALSSPGELSIIQNSIYDSKGRYVEETINSLNQSAYVEYDEFSGKPLSTVTVDGLSNAFSYDEFYRVAATTDALGNTETYTYTWDLMPNASGTNYTEAQNAWYHITRSKPGNPGITTWYDLLDRERKVQTTGFGGQSVKTVTSYTEFGAVKTTTSPFVNTMDAVITTNVYHADLNYLTSTGNSAGSVTYTYANTPAINSESKIQKVTISAPSGTSWTKTDMAGKVVRSHDDGGELVFYYDSWGNTRRITDGNNIDLNNMTYDAYGRQATLSPGSGTWTYTYNAYDQLVSEQDPMNNTRTTLYDVFGRVTQESGPEGVTSYTYVSSGNGLNKVATIQGFNGIVRNYTYDGYNRLHEIESIMGFPMTISLSYTASGRLAETFYSTGFSIQNIYDGNGYLWKKNYVDGSGIHPLLVINEHNHLGQTSEFWLGNGETSTVGHNAYGMPVSYYTPGIQDLNMTWDVSTGNLTSRSEGSLSEEFGYDNLQRLISAELTGGGPLWEVDINSIGDITSKHDAGTLYNGYYKVDKVKNDFWEIPAPSQTVNYTAFNEPNYILEDIHKLEFVYGPARNRMQCRFFLNGSGNFNELRHYLPEMNYEVVKKGSQEDHLYYVPLTANSMAILKHGAEPNSEGSLVDFYYVYKDHLGSWLKVVDENATLVAEQNFDAWGRRRDPATWDYASSYTKPDWLIRGYTGHEHLDEVGIIHMNGRLYDPVIGYMFSPDNFVQLPYYSQSYNRYAYAFNNPIKYTDPSGEIVPLAIVVPMAIGAAAGAYMGYKIGAAHGAKGWKMAAYIGGGAAVGGLSGFVGASVATSGMAIAGTASIASSSYIYSVGTSMLAGGYSDVSMNFGAASYNFSNREFGYLGKEGNSTMDNIGYGVGALANVADILAGLNPGEVQLRTENDINNPTFSEGKKDLIGHSQITDMNGQPLVDWGPTESVSGFGDWVQGTNNYERGFPIPRSKMTWDPLTIDAVNANRISNWNPTGNYNLGLNSCVSQTSRALNASGVFNIGIHPYLLHGQMYMRSIGIRPLIYSHYLFTNY